ncbi:twin-arginine translocation signal domain-containing protein, partial [Thiocapsa sp.]|uniref:twin-arginine translocation signal domain-containing protein n=1 Tax=Thiocapsa sp. TaxID=2024551 RepID=UPI002B668C45
MELNRRTFLKSGVAAATAMAVGIPVSRIASVAAAETEQDWRWDKGVCRFCGVGCGIMIATQDGKIVATKGDPDAPVNRGLNCVKGYF